MQDPRQRELFCLFESRVSPGAYRMLVDSFYGVFRASIIALMPAAELAKNFSRSEGRPTKELYGMAGLILIKEFNNWTIQQAVEAYLFDTRVHFALNMSNEKPTFCTATMERYMALIREDGLTAKIFDEVTQEIIIQLEINIKKQRLDSTHVFSDMATFARTKLMGVTIQRFLVQLKRHHDKLYQSLAVELRNRYEKKQNQMFADAAKNAERRASLRSEVAREMYELIQKFSDQQEIEGMSTFKNLVTVFNQQCEVKSRIKVIAASIETQPEVQPQTQPEVQPQTQHETEVIVEVRKKTGGAVIQNPSDLGASYDGKKGPGYQVQIAETCHPDNPVQIITCALPQTASAADANAVIPVLDKLHDNNLQPGHLVADTAYGGDDNVLEAAALGITLQAPVSGSPPSAAPLTEPGKKQRKAKEPSDKQKRLEARRKQESTPEWRDSYKTRAPIEGTNSGLKRRTGLTRLRVRGQGSVFAAINLKLAGWNIARAAASPAMREKVKKIFHLA